MTYTFFITTALSFIYEVTPLNWLECSLVDEKETDQIFYRRNFNGSLTFGGKKLCVDYNIFRAIEVSDPCEYIYLLILKDGDVYWEGYFSTSMGKWDLDNQTFTVTPIVIDDYTDWDDFGKDEVNFLDAAIIPHDVAHIATTHTASYTYDSNRWLIDVITVLGNHVFGTINLETDFFTVTPNYVTGLPNKYTLLTIAQKSDIKRPTASSEATVANLSFMELMEILRIMFNVYWVIEIPIDPFDPLILRIEHLSYFTKTNGIDLRTQEIALRTNKYVYNKEKMPRYEKFSWMEASNKDFIGISIKYDKSTGVISPCVTNDEVEYIVRVTTDIEMIENDQDSVDDAGFVILANYLSGVLYYVYRTFGIYAMETRYNNDLSWGNLHYALHRHGRILETGYMNDDYTIFASTIRNKKQQINAILCEPENINSYDPKELITTELGETYFGSEKGEVLQAVIHPYGEVNFTLLYGETNNSGESNVPPIKTLDILEEFVLHNNSWIHVYLSESSPYPLYFWTYYSERECQAIVVPAGVMNYSVQITGLLTGDDPIVWTEMEYNLDHASLIDWDISLHHTLMTIDDTVDLQFVHDAECGNSGGTPPPPVAPVVTVDVTAAEYNPPGSGDPWYIENESGSIAIGSTTLSITFKPQECTIPGSHLVYIRVKRNTIVDAYSTVYCKSTWQCNKNITVTTAISGDVYEVELSESSWT